MTFPVQEPRVIPGFKVVQQAASLGYLTPGPVTVAKTLARHGVTPPPHISEAALNPGLNTEPIVTDPGIYDVEYYSPVQIGLPAQTLMLDFGTVNSDLAVFSSELPSYQSSGHTLYYPGHSSTAKLLPGLTWYGEYIGGGNVYNQTVSIGNNSITAMAVEAFQNLTNPLTWGLNCSGVVGLNRQMSNDMESTSQPTFFSRAIAGLDLPLFTANLKHGEAGNWNFGYIDTTENTGNVTYVPIANTSTSSIDNDYWAVNISSYAVGSAAPVSLGGPAVIDSLATVIQLPDAALEAYYSQVDSAVLNSTYGGYIFNCTSQFPDLTFEIGSYKAVVPGNFMNLRPAASNSALCYGGLQSQGSLPYMTLGIAFMKSQFIVFNATETPSVGLAAKAGQEIRLRQKAL